MSALLVLVCVYTAPVVAQEGGSTSGAPVVAVSNAPAASSDAPVATVSTQEAVPAVVAEPAVEAPAWLSDILTQAVTKAPWVSFVLLVIGTLRLTIKPIMSFIEARVAASESKDDDASLAKFKESKIWKAVCYALDMLASVKIGTQATKK